MLALASLAIGLFIGATASWIVLRRREREREQWEPWTDWRV